MSLLPTIQMTNEFCQALTDMERAGCKIDMEALDEIELWCKKRLAAIEPGLQKAANEALGDTFCNLSSPAQLSVLFYGCKPKDKKVWAQRFELKSGEKPAWRANRLDRLLDSSFISIINSELEKVYKTTKSICPSCGGSGSRNAEIDGNKRRKKCGVCGGKCVIFTQGTTRAGFGLPLNKRNVTSNGFASNKKVLEAALFKNISAEAKEFILLIIEYHALHTYLSTFIGGIRNNVINGVLHPHFNQTVTKTGRLSSSGPNFQNLPKRDKSFPIRKVIISRWEGGKILKVDWSQLEFRWYGFVAQDQQVFTDLDNKVDIHTLTWKNIEAKYKLRLKDRDDAKKYTFAPLYGASMDWGFRDRYTRLTPFQDELLQQAAETGKIVLASGREFMCKGMSKTQLVNYPIQGGATADLVPAVIVEIWKALKPYKSRLILTVHDDKFIDVHPEELDIIPGLVYSICKDYKAIMKRRFNMDINIALDVEMSIGNNGLEQEKI